MKVGVIKSCTYITQSIGLSKVSINIVERKLNSKFYDVIYERVDQSKREIKLEELVRRAHCTKISNSDYIKALLEKVGFRNVTTEVKEGYPFTFIKAQK